mmetsp:Transcript_5909/g.19017  ORF Transcript_5909/g.19017 Transcript_5909/m.19017 type:complete len:298 (-) Transcript_5909:436-1329(-)
MRLRARWALARPAAAVHAANAASLATLLHEPLALDSPAPSLPARSIPLRIVQTCSQEQVKMFRSFMASWRDENPDCRYQFYDDDDALAYVRSNFGPQVVKAYESMPSHLPVLKADFFRYLAILAHGGVYSDADTDVLKPVANWSRPFDPSQVGAIVGIESDSIGRKDWKRWFPREMQISQWTFAARPGHPILHDVVNRVLVKSDAMLALPELNDTSVMEWTGPGVFTDAVLDYLATELHVDWRTELHRLRQPKLFGDVLVLSTTGFSPGMFGRSESVLHPQALAEHLFYGTWHPVDY